MSGPVVFVERLSHVVVSNGHAGDDITVELHGLDYAGTAVRVELPLWTAFAFADALRDAVVAELDHVSRGSAIEVTMYPGATE